MGIAAMSPARPPQVSLSAFGDVLIGKEGGDGRQERLAGVLSVLSPGGHQGWASEVVVPMGYQSQN